MIITKEHGRRLIAEGKAIAKDRSYDCEAGEYYQAIKNLEHQSTDYYPLDIDDPEFDGIEGEVADEQS